MTKLTATCIDLAIVLIVSLTIYWLERLVTGGGLVLFGIEAHGVTAVIGGALTAVAVVFWRGGSFEDLGFRRPPRWATVPLQVIAIIIAFGLVQFLAISAVSPFFEVPEPDLSGYAVVEGNLVAASLLFVGLPLTASIPEEIIYRGFLIGRLTDVFGRSTRGSIYTVLVAALIFGSIHFEWGIGGMIVTAIMGCVWGTAYLLCNRNLWVVILAHSTGHLLLVTQLYLGESIII